MKVTVKVYGALKRFLPGKQETVVLDVPDAITIGGLLTMYTIPDDEVWIIHRNKVKAEPDEVLKDGDEVSIYTPVGGG